MDIKNLLCNTNTAYIEYEKHVFEYCPPSSLSAWSIAFFISSESNTTAGSLSPIISDIRATKQHQTRTPWTPSEDCLLEKGYLQGLSWAMISSNYLPHRSRGCCWGRFKTLITKSTEKKSWSESDNRVLVGTIKKHTKIFEQAWRSVALDLNDIDWRKCESRSARISSLLSSQQKRHAFSS